MAVTKVVMPKLSEQMETTLYLNHPYGRPVIGWRHEIEQLTREDERVAEEFDARRPH